MQVSYKKPSEFLITKIHAMVAQHRLYMKSAQDQAREIYLQAQKEGIPNEQLRKLIETKFKEAGLSDRTLRKALPPELKNQNMVRKPKKTAIVKEWQIEFPVQLMMEKSTSMYNMGRTKGTIIHDNKRVVDIE